MDLKFNIALADRYRSKAQIARVLTEDWLARNMYCPICGQRTIRRAEANAPVKDCICESCRSQYELKSKHVDSNQFQTTVPDGAYQTMIERFSSLDNPSFFFMHYNRYEVNNLIIVPKCFFIPEIIVKRKQLSVTACRTGWEGCNILMREIPSTAKIPVIKDGMVRPIEEVIAQYKKVFELQTRSLEGRGWLVDTLQLVERLGDVFTLDEMYRFTEELQQKYPNNHHIPDKIRQQLQFLRDKGFIEFQGRGIYRKI